MKRDTAINVFLEGMIMDLNPLTTPNNVLTNCLNGTIITYNGNEHVLLNDMGNGRVETAYLPEGYVPLGTAELGGIIYIVSYNPLTKKCLIGSFPSPERNIMIDGKESDTEKKLITGDEFKTGDDITSTQLKLFLSKDKLNPGDKFKIYTNAESLSGNSEKLSAYGSTEESIYDLPKYIRLHIVSIGDNGEITYLDDYSKWYDTVKGGKYYLTEADTEGNVDSIRSLADSGYNVFGGKTSGKLGILALLEVIDSFSVGWDYTMDDSKKITLYFFTNWTYDNPESRFAINPSNFKLHIDGIGEIQEINATIGDGLVIVGDDVKKDEMTLSPPMSEYDPNENVFKYKDSFKDPRKNDGSDNDFLLKATGTIPHIKETISYTITPQMPFGNLKNLAVSGSIDLSKLGTDKITLTQWRYYVEPNSVILNWGLDAYVDKHNAVSEVKFEMYEFNSLNIDITKINKNTYSEGVIKSSAVKKYERVISGRTTYSGKFNDIFNFQELDKDNCYLTKITIKYGNKNKVFYRILYTTPIFNEAYLESREVDFLNLKLQDYLKIEINTNVSTNLSNIQRQGTIPGYFDLKLTVNKDYSIEYKTSKQLKLTADIRTNYAKDLFKINLNNPSVRFKEDPTFSFNPEQLFLKTPETLDKVTIVNNNKVSLNTSYNNQTLTSTILLNDTITTPIKILYDSSSNIIYLNLLQPLTVRSTPYLISMFGHKYLGHSVVLLEAYTNSEESGKLASYKLHQAHEDQGDVYKSFWEMDSIHNYIKNDSTEDIIPVIYTVALFGDDPQFFGWSWPTGDSTNIGTKNINESIGAMLIRNRLDLLNNFPATSWISKPVTTSPDKYGEQICEGIKAHFRDYYKLVENTSSVGYEVFKIGDANFYKDFEYTGELTIDLSTFTSLNTKSVEINDIGINFSNLPDNIYASLEMPTFKINYSNYIPSELILDVAYEEPKITGRYVSEGTYESTLNYYTNFNDLYKLDTTGKVSNTNKLSTFKSSNKEAKIDRGTLKIWSPLNPEGLFGEISVRFKADDEGIFIKSFL